MNVPGVPDVIHEDVVPKFNDRPVETFPQTGGFSPGLIGQTVGVQVFTLMAKDTIDANRMEKYVGRLNGYSFDNRVGETTFYLDGLPHRTISNRREHMEVFLYL
ncbi:hypothetical protein SEA_TRIBBY_56 [Arthrobacter phage Tribby]|uniref:Uncharacterized protein n=1 Tax=Arthrobacter phage Tribby TaxID=2024279 RepID=A0A222Z946_9CAUD|nr:hypothetical protein PQB75_gp056 [Arthrobacter phage Tribby]ASR80507.1 hypothetical protein SEA_TRIBBY_56 [Arthrobacter phage Tribby]